MNPFWLPHSTDFSDAPKKKPPGHEAPDGTKPPVSAYKSPFIGKKAEEVAGWLRAKPDDVDIDMHFFAILDRTAKDGFVVMGRQGGYRLEDLNNLEFIRTDPYDAGLTLYGQNIGLWEDTRAGSSVPQENLDNIKY